MINMIARKGEVVCDLILLMKYFTHLLIKISLVFKLNLLLVVSLPGFDHQTEVSVNIYGWFWSEKEY